MAEWLNWDKFKNLLSGVAWTCIVLLLMAQFAAVTLHCHLILYTVHVRRQDGKKKCMLTDLLSLGRWQYLEASVQKKKEDQILQENLVMQMVEQP